jgi:hypothetical protein
VLNADFTPIGLIDWTKAITLDFKGIVRVVDFYKDDFIPCSAGVKWPAPAVVSLLHYKKHKKKDIPFSRKNVFLRDKLVCQYCGQRFRPKELTYDHVVPRSKWKGPRTPTCWENIVSCCHPCNNKKGDMMLHDSGMKLKKPPSKPNPHGFVLGLAPWTKVQPEWVPYLPKHYLELLDELNED